MGLDRVGRTGEYLSRVRLAHQRAALVVPHVGQARTDRSADSYLGRRQDQPVDPRATRIDDTGDPGQQHRRQHWTRDRCDELGWDRHRAHPGNHRQDNLGPATTSEHARTGTGFIGPAGAEKRCQMHVSILEPRRHHQARGIDHPRRLALSFDIAAVAESDDDPIADSDCGAIKHPGGSVEIKDPTADDQEIATYGRVSRPNGHVHLSILAHRLGDPPRPRLHILQVTGIRMRPTPNLEFIATLPAELGVKPTTGHSGRTPGGQPFWMNVDCRAGPSLDHEARRRPPGRRSSDGDLVVQDHWQDCSSDGECG